ncbi:MAG: diguanylate cyclase [Clostridiaceae bacterium]|jgi:diguanylate cyclase (GGDEF)-like protein/putative nucleotidyltransferase with HDIG domain|nr:diguanylate cyclase [Clostridiaceae bacterium]
MNDNIIKANMRINGLQRETISYSNFWGLVKDRATPVFIILAIIYILIEALQASGILPISVRAFVGVFEIGISIFFCYKYGYLGALLCIPTNAIAAVKMASMARMASIQVVNNAQQLTSKVLSISKQLNDYSNIVDVSSVFDVQAFNSNLDTLLRITNKTSGLLYCLSATRIAVIVACIMVTYIFEQARKNIKRLEFLANIDGVTGLYNHRYFQTRLEEEIKKADETNSSLGMIMVDLDNFKKYNDNYGHKAGDLLLSKSSNLFLANIVGQDVVCRYGGDEFAILLPDTNSDKVLLVIEQIREEFDKMVDDDEVFELPDKVTISAGYSIYPDLAKTKDELIVQADSALYRAKNMGRNNVQLYRDVFEDIKYFYDSDEKLFGGLRALLGTVSAKDKYTLGHSERVMEYAVMIAKAMGLSDERIRLIKIAALLHDIGKVEIPESVLNKSGSLTTDDRCLLQKHPVYSVDILEPLAGIDHLIDSIKYHHERFDGKGYPSGIKGDKIPLEARILCVADSFDAMLSDRPYRKGMKINEIVEELKNNSGTQFDPSAVQAFLSVLNINQAMLA